MSIDYQDLIDRLKTSPTLKEVLDDDLCIEVDDVDSDSCELTAVELNVNFSDRRSGQHIEVESFSVTVPNDAITTSFEVGEEDRAVLHHETFNEIMQALEACLHTEPDDGVGPKVTELEQTVERLLREKYALCEENGMLREKYALCDEIDRIKEECRREKEKRKQLVNAILVIREQSEEFSDG